MKQVEQLQNKEPCSLRSTLLVGFSKNRSPCVPKHISTWQNIFTNFYTGFCYDTCERSKTGEIIADVQNVFPYVMFWHCEQPRYTWRTAKLHVLCDSTDCCTLIGQKNTNIFWHQSEAKKTATVWNHVPRGSPPHSLLFFAPFIPTI